MDGNRDAGRSADAVSRVKRDVPQANVELVLSMQRPSRQDEKRDSRDWVRLPMRAAQFWVADITYVTVIGGFAYVAVVLDAWSRRVVGYAISRSIDVRADAGGPGRSNRGTQTSA
jgi:transposase InsO family protein